MEQLNNKHFLLLKITNNEFLQSGRTNEHRFGIEGGTLGSNSNSDWSIQDLYLGIPGIHTQIDYKEGAFFISLIGKLLIVNDAHITERTQVIKLQHGDKIQIGQLILSVRISSNPELLIDPLSITPEQIISSHSSPMEDILNSPASGSSLHDSDGFNAAEQNQIIDPLKAIESDSLSPITSFYDDLTASQTHQPTIKRDDYRSDLQQGDVNMSSNFVQVPHVASDKNLVTTNRNISELHLGLAPLLRGIGVNISLENTDEANAILEELGETIKASIEGLLKLQQSQNILNDKNLRAIEDNPLRLNLSYADTMNMLFAPQTCSVHLSAPAAIAESLSNVSLHNSASQAATRYALSSMLDAFSPEQLLNRFSIYRHSRKRNEMDGAWSWHMYCSYFNELSSNRQTGFEKLFWEHYEQEYDRELRRLNQEKDKNA
ncbi:type VI secretion system-associated FHA domain protein TagH [Budvicia aquatica]|uniref:type VI secretion system-associated FHA domain protein TagH n=1 Tax=Budvicia aquatica TaxID=82979 RepID=UPI00208D620C|nr:type VI secretion system-associated FHA domain protein TagH [Budvicia aquatica]GKX52686.1 phosphopeptide-binding protein [Budvicia aquatica]